MSHPNPSHDRDNERTDDSKFAPKKVLRKMSPIVHSRPEYKEARKAFQGINATTKGSIAKSKKRHAKHQALKAKMK